MNHFTTSAGSRVSKATIDYKVTEAKKKILQRQRDLFGYNFCEKCGRSKGLPLDCAHTVPVDRYQKDGRCELAWDLDNIRVLCRDCHNKQDKTTIG